MSNTIPSTETDSPDSLVVIKDGHLARMPVRRDRNGLTGVEGVAEVELVNGQPQLTFAGQAVGAGVGASLTPAQVTAGGTGVAAVTADGALLDAGGVAIGAPVADAASLTLTAAMANTTRTAAGTQTYTINAATAWAVSDGVAVFLPASGAVSFAVTGGPTLNGGTSTLTRTLVGNAIGYVVLSRVAGIEAYSLSGV